MQSEANEREDASLILCSSAAGYGIERSEGDFVETKVHSVTGLRNSFHPGGPKNAGESQQDPSFKFSDGDPPSGSSKLHEHEALDARMDPYISRVFSKASARKEQEHSHRDKSSFRCRFCDENFENVLDMLIHERNHKEERPFACRFCKRTFKASSALLAHERMHNDDHPHVCRFCQKVLLNSSHLTRHERIHTGVHPFVCEFCEKAFKDSSHLKRHKRTHTGLYPYFCKVCKKPFHDSSHLQRHQRTHK